MVKLSESDEHYLPQMKENQNKYSEEDLIKKIVQENIPDSWQEQFELLDGPKNTSLRAVQLILQKIERCENVENQTKVEDKSQKHQKNKQKSNRNDSKYKNPCKKPGHDRDWNDCPDNWKNKNADKEKKKVTIQENHLILAEKEGFFDSSDLTTTMTKVKIANC